MVLARALTNVSFPRKGRSVAWVCLGPGARRYTRSKAAGESTVSPNSPGAWFCAPRYNLDRRSPLQLFGGHGAPLAPAISRRQGKSNSQPVYAEDVAAAIGQLPREGRCLPPFMS